MDAPLLAEQPQPGPRDHAHPEVPDARRERQALDLRGPGPRREGRGHLGPQQGQRSPPHGRAVGRHAGADTGREEGGGGGLSRLGARSLQPRERGSLAGPRRADARGDAQLHVDV
eukprot:1731763-Lingulodinium_polyedra.AAC.1